jgi:sugar phosphate isomerase/epimerase
MEPAQREAAIQRVFISMPAKKIDGHYWDVIERGRLNLEIGLDSASIDALGKEKLTGIARRLKGLGLNATVHAPFNEIFLGAPDRLVREAALARLDGAFDIAEAFSPRAVVVHLNFEERRFRYLYDTGWSM